MSLEAVLVIAALIALGAVWLFVASKEPPIKRRNTADYRHQQFENPDYMPKGLGV